VPGYLAGVYHAGEQIVVAEGVANVTTGAPMMEDTGYLVGSVTKVFTTTLLLRCVERGQVNPDEHVTTYLPRVSAKCRSVWFTGAGRRPRGRRPVRGGGRDDLPAPRNLDFSDDA
jgi:CubicO group peptidase (beta-lactamase class C family)